MRTFLIVVGFICFSFATVAGASIATIAEHKGAPVIRYAEGQ